MSQGSQHLPSRAPAMSPQIPSTAGHALPWESQRRDRQEHCHHRSISCYFRGRVSLRPVQRSPCYREAQLLNRLPLPLLETRKARACRRQVPVFSNQAEQTSLCKDRADSNTVLFFFFLQSTWEYGQLDSKCLGHAPLSDTEIFCL